MLLNKAMTNIAKYHDTMITKAKLSLSEIADDKQCESATLISPEPLPAKYEIKRNFKKDNKLKYTLKILDLDKLFEAFDVNMITFNDLFLLSKEDMIEMKIPIGPRNRILHFAEKYKNYAKTYSLEELFDFFNLHRELIINEDFFKEHQNESFRDIKSNSHFDDNNSKLLTSNTSPNCKDNNEQSANYIMKNFQSLFNEVEDFQMKYRNMKRKNDLRNDKINSLLSNNNNISNVTSINNNNHHKVEFDKDDLLNETERNLNDELSKLYDSDIKNISIYSTKNISSKRNNNRLLNALYNK